MHIWVDADACPVVVKDILFRACGGVLVLTQRKGWAGEAGSLTGQGIPRREVALGVCGQTER